MEEKSYYEEIKSMMFGFGDSKYKPKDDAVKLVESIIQHQLRMLVHEAGRYQKGIALGAEELVFLMRRNKYKMQRFIKYLQNKDLKKKINGNVIDLTDMSSENPLIGFIKEIDETGELTDTTEFDEMKHERLVRADRISIALNEEQYKLFSKARCASFSHNKYSEMGNLAKLKDWLDPKEQTKISPAALEVLSYFAYETVAQLIDYVLLVRVDNHRSSDPLSGITGSFFTSSMFNAEYRYTRSDNKIDYNKINMGNPPVSVAEVKEVMRRIYMPQAGKLSFGGKLPDTHYLLAL